MFYEILRRWVCDGKSLSLPPLCQIVSKAGRWQGPKPILDTPAPAKLAPFIETTLNRQGADVGTQYRSAIFFHSEAQKKVSSDIIQQLNKQGVYPDPVVTEVTQYSIFYPAEDYHVNYFERNKNQPYCQFVVAPKVAKFEQIFRDKIK